MELALLTGLLPALLGVLLTGLLPDEYLRSVLYFLSTSANLNKSKVTITEERLEF